MIKMPYLDIIERIRSEVSISQDELDEKIKDKMDQLSGLISKEGAAYIVANDLGVKLVQAEGLVKIKNIISGMRSVETVGKVIRKFNMIEFERNERKGKVASLILADETGQIRVTMWNDQADLLDTFSDGCILKIKDAYVRENQGQKELHLNDRSKVTVNPEGVNLDSVAVPGQGSASSGFERPSAQRKAIKDLTDSDQNVEIFGTVVQVFDPRFYEVCPKCGKRIQQREEGWMCQEHGQVSPAYSYVLNAFLDDGTDNVRVVLFKNQANNLFGKTDDEMVAFKDSPGMFEPLKTDILGEQVKFTGRVSRNQMMDRLEFVARFVEKNIDPEAELKKLKAEAGAGPVASSSAVDKAVHADEKPAAVPKEPVPAHKPELKQPEKSTGPSSPAEERKPAHHVEEEDIDDEFDSDMDPDDDGRLPSIDDL